jgi:hypothetical protein
MEQRRREWMRLSEFKLQREMGLGCKRGGIGWMLSESCTACDVGMIQK